MFRTRPTRRAHVSLIPWIAFLILSLPSQAFALSLQGTCGDVLNSSGTFKLTNQTQQANLQQKLGLCQAAAAADNAAGNQRQAAMVWVGVAAVCTAACIKQQNPTMNQAAGLVCTIANMGGGASDKMADQRSQDFQNQLKAAATIQQVQVPNVQPSNGPTPILPTPTFEAPFKAPGTSTLEKMWRDLRELKAQMTLIEFAYAEDPATPAGGAAGSTLPINGQACTTAVGAAFNAFQKEQAAKGQEQTRDQNLTEAQALNTNADPAQNAPAIAGGLGARPQYDEGAAGNAAPPSGTKTADGGVVGGKTPGADTNNGTCSGAGDSQAVIACVSKKDSSLPSGVNSPAFQNQFQNQTGKNLGDLVKSGQTASSVAPGLLASGLSDGAQNLVAAATSAFAKTFEDPNAGKPDASAVASKDAGAGSAATDPPAFDTPATTPPATSTTEFERSPAAKSLGGKLTLFEIVTQRYHLCMDRIEKLTWSTPYNRLSQTQGPSQGPAATKLK